MKLFLSVPFSSQVDDSGKVHAEYRQKMEKLIGQLRGRDHDVFCALEYAQWQIGGMASPEQELRHDFEQIEQSDKVIVLLEERVSAGVQLEKGYAYAKGKTVDVYQIGKPAWSNIAFSLLSGHEIRAVRDIDDFIERAVRDN